MYGKALLCTLHVYTMPCHVVCRIAPSHPPYPSPLCTPNPSQPGQAGKRFDVVVVDSRPLLEGRRMLSTLLEAGVTCEYCHLSALSYQITEVDKVCGL